MGWAKSACRRIFSVFAKEVKDHSRDTRSLLGSLVLPIVGPVMVLVMVGFVSDMRREKPLEVPVIGAANAPALVQFLKDREVTIQAAPENPEQQVLRGEVSTVLKIDEHFGDRFDAWRPARVELLVDDSNNQARSSAQRLERLLHEYSQTLSAQRLIARGLLPEVVHPLSIAHINLASREKLTAQLLNVIPLMLMLAGLMGGMNIAIDATAGERERGSLEPLLCNPVPRVQLVLGKWLATILSASAVVLLALLGFVLAVRVAPLEEIGLKVSFGLEQSLWAGFVIMPLVLMGSALQLLVALFAKSFKEAQTYLSLVNLLPMIPSAILMLNPGKAEAWMRAVPGLGQVVIVGELLRGEAVAVTSLALCWASGLGLALVLLWGVVQMLSRERIIFGR